MASIDDAYDRATTCFLQDSPSSLHGVIWLSAHLAAMERAIETGTARHMPQAQEQLRMQRDLSHRLHTLLRAVEQQRAGDALASHASWPSEREVLLGQLKTHAAGERALIVTLTEKLDNDAINKLRDDYLDAFERGPTRPHPHGGHFGALGFRLSAARDHLLDVLDSRSSPIPRKRSDRPPLTRWGQYFLGTSDVDSRLLREPDKDGE
jgi:hypothetical protein